MIFNPKSEKDIAENKLLKKGDYPFEIIDAFERKSNNNNDMFELKVRITSAGETRTLTDYVLPKRPEKLMHCCSACGILEKYDAGILDASDFQGATGKLRLGIENDRSKRYPAKNVVVDYVCASRFKSTSEV